MELPPPPPSQRAVPTPPAARKFLGARRPSAKIIQGRTPPNSPDSTAPSPLTRSAASPGTARAPAEAKASAEDEPRPVPVASWREGGGRAKLVGITGAVVLGAFGTCKTHRLRSWLSCLLATTFPRTFLLFSLFSSRRDERLSLILYFEHTRHRHLSESTPSPWPPHVRTTRPPPSHPRTNMER